MFKTLFVLVAITASGAFASIEASAQQQPVACPKTVSSSGWCIPAPAPRQQAARQPVTHRIADQRHVDRPDVVGAPILVDVDPSQVDDEEDVQVDAHAAQPAAHGRCPLGGEYSEVARGCIINGPPTAYVANDPECQGQPSGHRFERLITGPNGMRGYDHRVCD
jgi:hypothetical protein